MLNADDVAAILNMCLKLTGGTCKIRVATEDASLRNYSDPFRIVNCNYTDFTAFRTAAYNVSTCLEDIFLAEKIAAACPGCSVMSFRGESWRRIAPPDSNKETALRFLSGYLHIGMEDVIAFGDDLNDLGMLKIAGTAVDFANAIGEVKAVAACITESNDHDGVARYLDRTLCL